MFIAQNAEPVSMSLWASCDRLTQTGYLQQKALLQGAHGGKHGNPAPSKDCQMLRVAKCEPWFEMMVLRQWTRLKNNYFTKWRMNARDSPKELMSTGLDWWLVVTWEDTCMFLAWSFWQIGSALAMVEGLDCTSTCFVWLLSPKKGTGQLMKKTHQLPEMLKPIFGVDKPLLNI